MNSSSKAITGIGSALVDILLQESDAFLKSCNAPKGGMTLVDSERIAEILQKSGKEYETVAGGSACNTIVGAGRLGGNARFIGKRGRDELGDIFEGSLKKSNVEPFLAQTDSPTGRVLSVITPDAQRTMFTFLGAASEAQAEEIGPDMFSGTAIVHIEGYLLFNKPLIEKALQSAQQAGAKVSLDLAAFTVVEANKEILDELVDEYVDILIANEDEARAFTGMDDEQQTLAALRKHAEYAVLKLGKRGSFIAHGSEVVRNEIMGDGSAIDTTGAGDLWASGFLYGLAKGYALETCGKLGSACGYEVCQVIGATIPDAGWERIRKFIP
ncbi:MAG: adenosine kinase [Chitinivibrionales bacterium]|nr:adenosine kinase [Chitinivibrionales bacterium]